MIVLTLKVDDPRREEILDAVTSRNEVVKPLKWGDLDLGLYAIKHVNQSYDNTKPAVKLELRFQYIRVDENDRGGAFDE
jgi:hypothetical protein